MAESPDRETRDQLLHLLRLAPRTVEELAGAVRLTDNGVRNHLALLERDGLVERSGTRRPAGPGKPAIVYRITVAGERRFSTAYVPALTGLVDVLSRRLSPKKLHSTFTAVGDRLAEGASAPHGDPATLAVAVLESLGAAALWREDEKGVLVEGAACPLADAVRRCPDSCEIVRSLLAKRTGVRVKMRCEHGDAPRCRFRVG